MNQLFDREGAIERYLNGTISPAEKKEFMNRLEQDASLRRAVDAELLIGKAIRNDRTTIPAQPAESRARFLTMLATVAPEPSSIPSAEATAQPAAASAGAGNGSSLMNLLSGSGLVKGVIATLTGVAVTVGVVVLSSDSMEKNQEAALKEKRPAAEMSGPAPAAAAPQLPEPGVVNNQTAIPAQTAPAEGASLATGLREPSMRTGSGEDITAPAAKPSVPRMTDSKSAPATAEEPAAKLSTGKNTVSTPREGTSAIQRTQNNTDRSGQAQQRSKNDPPVVIKDSVSVRVNAKLPTIKP